MRPTSSSRGSSASSSRRERPRRRPSPGCAPSAASTLADMISGMTLNPGHGVDFNALGAYAAPARRRVRAQRALRLAAGLPHGRRGAAHHLPTATSGVDEKLARLPLRYFDDHPRGDVLSRMTNDIDNISQSLQQSLTQIITSTLTIIGVLIMMLTISWLLALISVLVVPISVVVTMIIAKRSQKQFAAQWETTGDLNGHVEEMFTGHNVVKVFGRQQTGHRHVRRAEREALPGELQGPVHLRDHHAGHELRHEPQLRRHRRDRRRDGRQRPHVARRRPGLHPVLAPVHDADHAGGQHHERAAEHGRVGRARLRAPRRGRRDARPGRAASRVEHTRGHITLRRRVVPLPAGHAAHRGLDARRAARRDRGHRRARPAPARPRWSTCCCASTRSTAASSASTASTPGTSTRSDLRRLFGMVLQDTWLFSGTIRENIAYGREGATEDEIRAAAQAAHVDHFVRALPDGYDTRARRRRHQRLARASASCSPSPARSSPTRDILILDEATSSVDTRTEVLIQQAMAELMKDRTSFVIAHRLTTIRGADIILVMDQGHDHRAGQPRGAAWLPRGFYYDLYTSQFEEALGRGVVAAGRKGGGSQRSGSPSARRLRLFSGEAAAPRGASPGPTRPDDRRSSPARRRESGRRRGGRR